MIIILLVVIIGVLIYDHRILEKRLSEMEKRILENQDAHLRHLDEMAMTIYKEVKSNK